MKKAPYALLLLMLAVTACSHTQAERDEEQAEEDKKADKAEEAKRNLDTYKPKLICPQVAVIRELEGVQDYGSEAPQIELLIAEGKMESVEGTCSYQDKGIDIAFNLKVAGAKGPKFSGDNARFPYFVAVVDPDQNILNKNDMTVKFVFKSSETIVTKDEPMHVFIPLDKDHKSTGPGYRVLTGFQLTEEQLKQERDRKTSKVVSPE